MNCVTTSAPQKVKTHQVPRFSRRTSKLPENSTRARRKRQRRTVRIVDELLPPRRHGCSTAPCPEGSAGSSPWTSQVAKARWGSGESPKCTDAFLMLPQGEWSSPLSRHHRRDGDKCWRAITTLPLC